MLAPHCAAQEMEIIRKEEMEAMKIEEITSGGFIPPQADVEAASFDVAPERYARVRSCPTLGFSIPLPGEQYGGRLPKFDEFGAIHLPPRMYTKKVGGAACFNIQFHCRCHHNVHFVINDFAMRRR